MMNPAWLAIIINLLGIIGTALYFLWMKDMKADVKGLKSEVSDLRRKVAAYTGDQNGGH